MAPTWIGRLGCAMGTNRIAEVQGLYGPVNVSERLLQKIWHRGDISITDLKTTDGQPLTVLCPGRWNLHEGPDFRDAEILVADRRHFGDVEIHFYARDWFRHGHDRNTEFDRVVLHVVLFPPPGGEPLATTSNGSRPHALVLLPYLREDLEEYATREALLAMEHRDDGAQTSVLLATSFAERRWTLLDRAKERWRQKVDYSRKRLERCGWMASSHQFCLEVLGYRRNRAPMHALATRYPIAAMAALTVEADSLFESSSESWKRAGIRPANQPRLRIAQYLTLLQKNPDWPRRLRRWGHRLSASAGHSGTTIEVRRSARMKDLRGRMASMVLAEAISGSRLDTLVCDAFLPLLCADSGVDLFFLWCHWYPSEAASRVRAFLRETEVVDGRVWPLSNGLLQGALQLFIEGA